MTTTDAPVTAWPLPAPYPSHPHATEQHRALAERGLILLGQIGSGVHGTAQPGQDDRDEMGVCLEPPAYVTGLRTFEQYQRHTAWDRGGLRERSGAGDLDVVVYSARKWTRLALAGNPTVLGLLFIPDSEITYQRTPGQQLRANADRFLSKYAVTKYLGYLRGQRDAMLGLRGAHTNRPELVSRFGYDTKFAMHALRLGLQGIELATAGSVTIPARDGELLRTIRRGELPKQDVIDLIDDVEARLVAARERTTLPDEPDRAWADEWLHRHHLSFWLSADE